MFTVSYERGTAPAVAVVIRGIGRSLNPPKRSGRPQNTNLSAHNYDNVYSAHRSGIKVNTLRTEAFDTPVAVFRKVTGWMTVAGGKDGLTMTYSPDAEVLYAEVYNPETEEVEVITNLPLSEYMDTYC